jgi:hypothetical protein
MICIIYQHLKKHQQYIKYLELYQIEIVEKTSGQSKGQFVKSRKESHGLTKIQQ